VNQSYIVAMTHNEFALLFGSLFRENDKEFYKYRQRIVQTADIDCNVLSLLLAEIMESI
jgi:hypothetical protein